MTTLRSLIAVLGFQVDTTPADRFNSAVNKSKNNLNSLNFISLGGFNKKLKKGLKVAAGIVATGITTGIVTALKFGNVKQALSQLKFQFKDSFQPLRDEVADILADPVFGKLTTELDLLNAAAAAVGEGIAPDIIIRNLKNILGFSTQFRQNITEGIAPFIDFIKSGNLEILLKTGRISAEQAQFLQAAGIGPGREAVRARVIRLEDLFKDISPEIRKSLQELIESGALSQKQLLNSLDRLALELGKRTLPLFKQLSDVLISFMDGVPKFISEFSLTSEALTSERVKQLVKKQKVIGVDEDEPLLTVPGVSTAETLSRQKQEREEKQKKRDIRSNKLILDLTGTGNNGQGNGQTTDNSSKTTNNISINVTVKDGATGDPNKIKQAVGDELGKIWGRSVEQSKNNRLIRGSGEVQ